MLQYLPTAYKCVRQENRRDKEMAESDKYYVVTKKAVPEVLLKVVEAKRLLESGRVPTIQDAVEAVPNIR